jgi:RimJ/RimL family protein N-acetyltransferase
MTIIQDKSMILIVLLSLVGKWTSLDQSTAWIKNCLADPTIFNFIVSVPITSPLYPSLCANTSIPKLGDGSLIVGGTGVQRGNEVGYMVHPAAWGWGIAPESLKVVIPAYFEKYVEQITVKAHTNAENERSTRVLRRLGFSEKQRRPFEWPGSGIMEEVIWEIRKEDGLRLKEVCET